MAVGTSTSYFSNAIVGVPQVGSDIDIYQVDTTPKYQVGFGFERADGNKYRYAHFGATANRGILVAPDVSESNSATPVLHMGSSSVVKPAGESLNPNAIGSHYIQCSMTAVAHQFTGGYASISSGSGLGYTYRIKDSTVTGDPSAGEVYLKLHEPLVVAVSTSSGVQIAGSPYSNLEAATSTDKLPVGATVSGASSTNFAWICTKGFTSVLQDAKIAAGVGAPTFLSTTTAGAIRYETNLGVVAATGTGLSVWPRVGHFALPCSNACYSVVKLSIE